MSNRHVTWWRGVWWICASPEVGAESDEQSEERLKKFATVKGSERPKGKPKRQKVGEG